MDREESFWEQEGTILLLLLAITNLPSNEHKFGFEQQTNKHTIINRVIRKVRRLGGENGQFLHNKP
jgi:hypothetical protein